MGDIDIGGRLKRESGVNIDEIFLGKEKDCQLFPCFDDDKVWWRLGEASFPSMPKQHKLKNTPNKSKVL